MKTILAARCVRRERRPDTVIWARRFVATSINAPVYQEAQLIVADLLRQVTR